MANTLHEKTMHLKRHAIFSKLSLIHVFVTSFPLQKYISIFTCMLKSKLKWGNTHFIFIANKDQGYDTNYILKYYIFLFILYF